MSINNLGFIQHKDNKRTKDAVLAKVLMILVNIKLEGVIL